MEMNMYVMKDDEQRGDTRLHMPGKEGKPAK
jgi:hypothetical protein